MFCGNCGNKIDENSYVCVHCGAFLKKRSDVKTKSDAKTLGVISVILGIVSLILSLMLFFHDISSAGMYTEIYERIFYAVDYSLSALLMSTVTFIFALISKKNNSSSIGLLLSLLSYFFIITEIVVVIIY